MAAIPPINQISQQQTTQYENYFRQVNPSGTGTIGAVDAASFLKKSGLPEGILHTIWDLADQGSKGYLDKQGFYVALKLISLAQSGNEVSLTNLSKPSAPPRMGESPRMSMAISNQVPIADTTSWGIKAKEKLQYDGIFDGLKPVNGLLSGEKVKPVFLNSKLPVDILGKIWDISDIDQDGSLDRDEFSVAMYLVYRALDGEAVPATLPILLIPPSKRKLPVHVSIPASAPTSLHATPRVSPTPIDRQWNILKTDRAKYDQLFSQADTDKDGLVSGGEIRDVLIATGLPQPLLAHIWNLCDKNNTGLLNANQFSFAMHLISRVKAGEELPKTVSAEMILPSQPTPQLPPVSKPSNDLSQISLESSSSDFSAIKELDQITTEIEALGREKASLQKEISETEEAIRNRKSEIEDLQVELQKGNKGIDILTTQKTESQSQLDSLDCEKSKFEEQLKEIQTKIADEHQMLNQMRSQHSSQQDAIKEQEIELQKARKELDSVRKEESELEQEIEKRKTVLAELKGKVSQTKIQVSQTQSKVEKLAEENNSLKEEINQYSTVSNNSSNSQNGSSNHLTELNDNFETRFKDMDQVSARATAGSSPVSSISGFSGSGGVGDDEENYDFKDSDPFKNKDDPFAGNESESIDPFNSDDPFKSDPFKTVSFADDPFSGDPFQDSDPFKTDPFKQIPENQEDNTSSTNGETPVTTGSDPFGTLDPFGSAAFASSDADNTSFSSSKAKSIESNSSDPFSSGDLFNAQSNTDDRTSLEVEKHSKPTTLPNDPFSSDPFASGDPFAATNPDDPFSSTSTATDDPFSPSHNVSNDPFLSATSVSVNDPFASSTAPPDPFATPTNLPNDPFISADKSSDDPFGSSSIAKVADSGDPWFAFGDASFNTTEQKIKKIDEVSPKAGEEEQLEWAKRESEREEKARQQRLKDLADREEMEMAIALKQSVESSSDA